jgi:sugar/nucleoside kinase (ribokinase family)
VVGNLNRDVVVRGIPSSASLQSDGETAASEIAVTVGGGGANSAAAAAALGAFVNLVAKVGADALADRLELALTGVGVHPFLTRDPHRPTGTSVALNHAGGSRHFVSRLPNAESMTFEDLDLRALQGCDHLLRADIWFSEAMLFGGNERLFRRAHDQGLAVSVDLNWDPLWGAAEARRIEERKAAVRSVLPLVDLVHGNVRELTEFTGVAELGDALARIRAWGAPAAVVHLGAAGGGYYEGGELVVEPPAPVSRIVQNTGTGDVLSVCMILLEGRRDTVASERLRLANRVVSEFMEGRRPLVPAIQ